MIDDDSGEYIRPAKQYLDNLIIRDPELGEVELWKSIAWNTAKLRNYMARADSAGAVDAGQAGIKQPPPLVADAIDKAKTDLALKIKDALDRLDQRMTALEKKADEEDRQTKAAAALQLAEDIAENAPQALLSSLADRTARLH